MTRVILLLLPLAACRAAAPVPTTGPSPALDRDLAAYAAASCFASLPQAFLAEQGDRWAGAVVQRGHGAIEDWAPIAAAVKAELERSGIAQGQGDGSQAPTTPLPVMTCGEIADTPAVRTAIAAARRSLQTDYAAAR